MNYLLDQARTGLANNGYPLDAIKYLGTLQSPEAEQVLESALDSSDCRSLRLALVNLLYNQSDSEKAKQVLIQRFNGGYKTTISVDLALEWRPTAPIRKSRRRRHPTPQTPLVSQSF